MRPNTFKRPLTEAEVADIGASIERCELDNADQLVVYLIARSHDADGKIERANRIFADLIQIAGTHSVESAIDTFAEEARMIDNLLELVECNDLEVMRTRIQDYLNIIVDMKQALEVTYSRELLPALQTLRKSFAEKHYQNAIAVRNTAENQTAKQRSVAFEPISSTNSQRLQFQSPIPDTCRVRRLGMPAFEQEDNKALFMPRQTFGTSTLMNQTGHSNTLMAGPSKFKTKKIEFFTGKEHENVSDFLYLLEVNFRAERVPDADRVDYAVLHLQGGALSMFRRLERSLNGDVDWDTFKQRLKREYMPFNQEMEFRRKLGRLRQGTGTFKEYLYNFNVLLNQLEDVTVLDQIYHFTNGLNLETSEKVSEERPTTLEKAIDIAAAHEQKFDQRRLARAVHNDNRQQPGQNFQRRDEARRSYFYKPQGGRDDRTINREQRAGRTFRPINKPVQNNPKADAQEKKKVVECYKCKRRGHYASECSQNTGNTQADKKRTALAARAVIAAPQLRDLIRVDGTINGKTITFTVDSGATETVLSRKVADALGLKRSDHGHQLLTATKNQTATVQLTEKVAIEIFNTVVRIPVLVHDLPKSHNCLLGLDWLHATKCMIDPGDHRLIFKQREICMKTQLETTEESDFTCLIAEIDIHTATEEEQIDEEQTWDEAGYVDVNIEFPDLAEIPDKGTENATVAISEAKQFLEKNLRHVRKQLQFVRSLQRQSTQNRNDIRNANFSIRIPQIVPGTGTNARRS